MLTRRMFLSDALIALAATGCSPPGRVSNGGGQDPAAPVAGAPPSKIAPRFKLNVASPVGVLCQVSWFIARERGFFAAEGLDVEFLAQETSRPHGHGFTSAWLIGPAGPVRTDLMPVEYPALEDIASGQMDYYVVAGEHSGCRQLVCPLNSPIHTAADLRGKRIATRPQEDTLVWESLIGPPRPRSEPVQWVRLPFQTGDVGREVEWVKAEFTAGRIDAYVSADPVPEILKADGAARLVASNTWTSPLNGWYCCMLAVRKELVDTQPDLAKSVTRAMRAATAFIEQNPAEAVALSVAKGHLPPSTPQDLCARLLKEYVWTSTGRIQEDLERYFALLIDAGRMPATTPPRELVQRVYRSGD